MAELELKFQPDSSAVREELNRLQQDAGRGVTVPVRPAGGAGTFAGESATSSPGFPQGPPAWWPAGQEHRWGGVPSGASPGAQRLVEDIARRQAAIRQAAPINGGGGPSSWVPGPNAALWTWPGFGNGTPPPGFTDFRTGAGGGGPPPGGASDLDLLGQAARDHFARRQAAATAGSSPSIWNRSILPTGLYFQALFGGREVLQAYQRTGEADRITNTIGGLSGAQAQLKAAEHTAGGFFGSAASAALDFAGLFSESVPTLSRARQSIDEAESGVKANLAMVGQFAALHESARRVSSLDAGTARIGLRGAFYRNAIKGYDEFNEARQEFLDKSSEMRQQLYALDGSDKVDEAQKLAGDIPVFESGGARELFALKRRADANKQEQVRQARRVLVKISNLNAETGAGLEGRFGEQAYRRFRRQLVEEEDDLGEIDPALGYAQSLFNKRRVAIEDLRIGSDITERGARQRAYESLIGRRPEEAANTLAAERTRRALEQVTDREQPSVRAEEEARTRHEQQERADRRRLLSASLGFQERIADINAGKGDRRTRGLLAGSEDIYGEAIIRAASAAAEGRDDDARASLRIGQRRLEAVRRGLSESTGGGEVPSPFRIGGQGFDDKEVQKDIDRKIGELVDLAKETNRLLQEQGLAP